MSVPFSRLNNQIYPRGQRGELGENEKWWAERQKALEQAGYMLDLDITLTAEVSTV